MDWLELLRKVSDRFERSLSFRCAGRKHTDALVQQFEITFKRPQFCVRFSDAFMPDSSPTLESQAFNKGVGCGFLWIDEYGSHYERVEARNEASAKLEWFPTFDMMMPILLAMPGYPSKDMSLRQLKNAIIDSTTNAECFVVTGELARPNDTELWFARNDFLPVKIIQRDRFTVMQASNEEQQIVSDCEFFSWVFNEKIDERLLAGPNRP
jgi:hypothetical protein